MMKHYAAIDLGATSGRVILASVSEDKSVTMKDIHRFPTPLTKTSGTGGNDGSTSSPEYRWDIGNIFSNIKLGLKKLAATGVELESIGVDTWGVDFVGLKSDGSLYGMPRSYRDPYSFAAMDEFFTKMSREELYDRTGIQIMNFNSVFQLYAQSKSGELNGVGSILFMPDAISYMLTGNKICEYTILSTSAIMNPRTKTLDEKILRLCGIGKNMFPEIVFPGHVVGTLAGDIQKETGLGAVSVVAVAGHDTASVVAAVPASDSHFAYLSSGTWSLMGVETAEPVINSRMQDYNFTNEGGASGTIRLLKNITGMWILEQCLARLREQGRDYTFPEIAAMAESCGKSVNVFNPDDTVFASPSDMPATINSYMEARGWRTPSNDAELFRLIYDSLAARIAVVFSMLKEVAPFRIDTLHIVGGGSRNDLLNRLTAEACQVKVVAGPAEGTALGNVMIQAGLSRQDILKSIEVREYD